MVAKYKIIIQVIQGRRKLFYGGGGGGEEEGGGCERLSKNVGHHSWPMRKNFKKTLAKTPFSSLPKNEI